MFQQFMQNQMNPFAGAGQGVGINVPQNAAPQLPMMQQQQKGGATQAAPVSAPQQSQGFFGNMMSSPTQMAAGLSLGDKAASGISSLFAPDAASGGMSAAAQPFFDAAASGAMPFGTAAQLAAPAAADAAFMGGGAATGAGLAGATGAGLAGTGALGAGAAGLAGAGAGAGLAAGAGAAGAAAGAGAAGAAAGASSMADLLPFLFLL